MNHYLMLFGLVPDYLWSLLQCWSSGFSLHSPHFICFALNLRSKPSSLYLYNVNTLLHPLLSLSLSTCTNKSDCNEPWISQTVAKMILCQAIRFLFCFGFFLFHSCQGDKYCRFNNQKNKQKSLLLTSWNSWMTGDDRQLEMLTNPSKIKFSRNKLSKIST